ncbi:MAG TPA: hypothetical protein VHH88_02755 [Verrucomicrobiae bacterium]|nr:hypothetical protein [Verrucomicrobiae bacterium]
MILLAAIHGILTNQTTASWPDKLDAWMFERAPGIKVLKKEYAAGPFPLINCWFKDPHLARGLANEIELFLEPSSHQQSTANNQLVFVSHSNGAVITLLTCKILIERGHGIAGIILTGAACEADISKNGILQWLTSPANSPASVAPDPANQPSIINNQPALGFAIAYSSPDDAALPGDPPNCGALTRCLRRAYTLLARPYGSLGRTGWLLNGCPIENQRSKIENVNSRLLTRIYPGGHSTYFAPDHIESTFNQILSDIRANSTP